MRAIVQPRYGAPEAVLELRDDVEMPTVAIGSVLVRVRAASVNAGDWRRVRASPLLVRLTEGIRRPRVTALGADAAGVVEAVGRDVTHVKPGDAVFGIRTGAFAEYVSGRNFVPKPTNVTFAQAAAVPVAGITALQAVRDKGVVKAGQRVLVNGAGGGVGTFAVQIAKALGASVTGVTSTANLDLVRSIGADHVIDYTREDFTSSGQRYDVIVDVGGNRSLADCRRTLTRDGTFVAVGAGQGNGGPMGRLIGGTLRSRLLKQRVEVFIAAVEKDDLLTLKELIEAGKVRPIVDRTYPLSQTAEALRYVEEGRARGKVVIAIAGDAPA